ncbi:hypothetical protein I6M90_16050 [Acinetobacter bereziniae]|uniref:hypothetical protein n=1 Tax=Acinetobacter bereziniae TaxID=106648 RepID=UPI001901D031|nr:hypothetical protein [Acinetobacter bereziniae]MBJ8452859.1 hypothetical protein [Acinetobacter bereziniae]MBJ8457569.1 hypothetical protein [Acinetobacter bereziniae]
MYNTGYSDCSQYMDSAEWLRLSDILNDWCKLDQSCKEIKKLAILGACERHEIEYDRNDGKSFDDPVNDLYGRGLLIINKRSFNQWKLKFENKEQKFNRENKNKGNSSQSFLDALDQSNNEYISIEEVLDAIHRNIGTQHSINKAIQVLNTAIGQAFTPPIIYKKDDFKGWIPVVLRNEYNGDFMDAPNPADQAKLETIHYLTKKVIEQKITKDLDDDLPF